MDDRITRMYRKNYLLYVYLQETNGNMELSEQYFSRNLSSVDVASMSDMMIDSDNRSVVQPSLTLAGMATLQSCIQDLQKSQMAS